MRDQYIMLAILILIIIGIIIKQIPWKDIAIKWVGNNPNRAIVYVKAGDTIRKADGKQDKVSKQTYHWKMNKKKENIILGDNYPYEYIAGHRVIGVEDGKAVASPLGFWPKQLQDKYLENSTDISMILEQQAVVKALHSIRQSRPLNWMTILIIGLVVVGGLWYYNTNLKEKPPVSTANVTGIQPAVNQPGEAIIIELPKETVTP
jgi:hypothetical protein